MSLALFVLWPPRRRQRSRPLADYAADDAALCALPIEEANMTPTAKAISPSF
jgi:hypothetical protein